jgi:two-component system, NarL family, response regulator DevR
MTELSVVQNSQSFKRENEMNPFTFSSYTTVEPTSHQRVLIIDDHEVFRHGLRALIESIDGFEVVAEGGSCSDALTLVGQVHIDLIILDMYLPDGDGTQVIRQLKRLSTNPPSVIILSAVMSDETLVEAILAGAEGYLTKDMPADDIVKSLEDIQQGQLALPRAVTTKLVPLLVQKFSEKEAELSSHVQKETSPVDATAALEIENGNDSTIDSNTSTPMLTQQEARVFELLRNGQSNKQIASQLSISPYTVGKHVQKILRKFGVSNRTQAVLYTSFEGGIDVER